MLNATAARSHVEENARTPSAAQAEEDAAPGASSRSRVCPVAFCPGARAAGALCCARCFGKLPETARSAWEQLRLAAKTSVVRHARSRLERFRRVAISRLDAEAEGPLAPSQRVRADQLTPLLTPFQSFVELIEADGGYVPLLSCDGVGGQCRDLRDRFIALADFYDRAQAHRGDPRRAVRLGWGGL